MSVHVFRDGARRYVWRMFALALCSVTLLGATWHLHDKWQGNDSAAAPSRSRAPSVPLGAEGDRPASLTNEALSVDTFMASLPEDVDWEQIDVRQSVSDGLHPVFNGKMIYFLEQMIGRAFRIGGTEANVEAVVSESIKCCVPPEHLAQAKDLLHRYMNYRSATLHLKVPAEHMKSTADSVRWINAERVRLQGQVFSAQQREGAFTESNQMDAYILARHEIIENNSLSAASRQQALEKAEQALPLTVRNRVQELGTLSKVLAQNAMHQDADVRTKARIEAFGAEAAERMAEVDLEQKLWTERVAQYAQASPEQQLMLKNSLFTAEERARLEGAVLLLAGCKGAPHGRPRC